MALTPRQAEELKAIVDERRALLRQEVDRDLDRLREDGLGNVIGAVPDPGDESVQSQLQELDRADASRDLSELRMLDAARARMAEGRYGVCSNCGQDIGFERLRANPAAERCIRCQTLYEKTHASALPPRL
jgi:DnaK suppressor protein